MSSPPLFLSYYKVTDPAHWINVDKNTGQLRVANTIDKESKFVNDAMYNVTMRAVDASEFTAFCFHTNYKVSFSVITLEKVYFVQS